MYFVRRMGHSWFGRGLIIFVAVLLLVNCAGLALAQESGAENAPAQQQSWFAWFIECSGLIGLIILICSVYFVALVARMFVELRMQTAMPPEIIAQCEAMLEQRDFKGIFNVVKEDDSFFSRVLVTGITELPNGLSEAREAMERIGEMLTTDMEKKISPMAVLGTLGPMIGLLGTLSGNDPQLRRNRPQCRPADQVGPRGQGYFGSPPADVRRRVAVVAGDCVLLVLPQPRAGDLGDDDDPCRRVPPPLRPGCPRQAGGRRSGPRGTRQGMKQGDDSAMSGSLPGGGVKAEPNLTPILDMVFQLITFFMLVINFKAAELDLSLQLPVLGSAKPLPEDQNMKLLVLNVQICTKCPHAGCEAMATLQRIMDEDTKKVMGYKLVCEHGHETPDAAGRHHQRQDLPERLRRLLTKESRGKDTPSIEEYLRSEADMSMMAASRP